MKLNLEKQDEDYIIIKLKKNQLEFKNASDFREKVIYLIDNGVRNIDIDFNDVKYIDSSGLGTLVFIVKNLQTYNGNLFLKNIDKKIDDILEISNLKRIFQIKSIKN